MQRATEEFWAGKNGADYLARNPMNEAVLARAKHFLFRALAKAELPHLIHGRVMELGANHGVNLRALRDLLGKNVRLHGIEINPQAYAELAQVADLAVNTTFLDPVPAVAEEKYDLVFTKGVLIHLSPSDLPRALEVLYTMSRRYILTAEYHSPRLEMVPYRGVENRLWKGPYAEMLLQAYPDLALRDYGFVSRLDAYPQDDLTYFLLEKQL